MIIQTVLNYSLNYLKVFFTDGVKNTPIISYLYDYMSQQKSSNCVV